MTIGRIAPAVLLSIVLAAGSAAAHGSLRLEGGTWWTGSGFEPRTFWVVDGVLRSSWDGPVDQVVDLKGSWIVPPLGDAHNHAFADGRDPSTRIASWLAQGIFYVKNPNNLPALAAPVRPLVNTPESVDVIYSNGGFTSPGGHPSQIYVRLAEHLGWTAADLEGQAYHSVAGLADLDAVWPAFLATEPDFVKVYLEHSESYEARRSDPQYVGRRGIDPALVAPLVERAHRDGLTVTAHVATAEDFRVAVGAGCDEIAHLPLERLTETDARAAARRDVTVVTTTLSHRPTDGIEDLDGIHRHNLRLLSSEGVRLALGVDGDPTVLDEMDNVRRLGVLEPGDLLRVALENTAQAIFPRRRVGRLTDGYEGSLLALASDPLQDPEALRHVTLRIKQGHVLRVDASAIERPSLVSVLAPLAVHRGAGAAIAEYERLLRERPDDFEFGEQPVNQLGYTLLGHGAVDEAIEIFRYNVRIHPDSANVYDSLGEACRVHGDRACAIENYRRSLELNPANANAREMLDKLDVTDTAE